MIVNQPNLFDQPKLYQNTEWFLINANEIVNVLELAGLIVEWEGTDNTRILVTDPDFKKDEK